MNKLLQDEISRNLKASSRFASSTYCKSTPPVSNSCGALISLLLSPFATLLHEFSRLKIGVGLAAVFLILGVATGCSVEPEAIAFGQDQCDYCRMGIVDPQHAAQFVTPKGKQHKFDSIECLVRSLNDRPDGSSIASLWVADFGQSQMVGAHEATYLISEGIRSPMGAFLSGFASHDGAAAAQEEHGGELHSRAELPTALKIE